MKSFSNYLTEEKNTHMTHIEDQVLDGGVKGARDAIMALRSLRDMLAGHTKGHVDVTVKWDGAPAVFAGIDPGDGKFFVAKKGIFNKSPKVYKTNADIDADTSGDLNAKLKVALAELSKLGIKSGVYQGDIMFTQADLAVEAIDGEKYVTFHPNTILYAVPANTPEAAAIKKAKIGVVWHTYYDGKTFEGMKASYGVDVSKFRKVSSVWAVSANLHDLSGTATLTAKETKEVTAALSVAGKIFQKTASNILKEIETNKELNLQINTFNNTYVRQRMKITNTTKHVKELEHYITAKYDQKIASMKSPAGAKKWEDAKVEALKFFKRHSTNEIAQVFELQKAIVTAKEIIINKLNKLNRMSTFVKTHNGFRVTGAEGFVAIDRLSGGAVKLVDRLEFSANNFSTDVIKGWDSPSRG